MPYSVEWATLPDGSPNMVTLGQDGPIRAVLFGYATYKAGRYDAWKVSIDQHANGRYYISGRKDYAPKRHGKPSANQLAFGGYIDAFAYDTLDEAIAGVREYVIAAHRGDPDTDDE